MLALPHLVPGAADARSPAQCRGVPSPPCTSSRLLPRRLVGCGRRFSIADSGYMRFYLAPKIDDPEDEEEQGETIEID